MKADIAVVGAGPAGSTAAEVAASAGMDVVLIDRKAEIGTPVQCGGFLPEAHELQELMPMARLPETLVELPERYILHRTRLQRMYAPSGAWKELAVDGRVVDRRAFDRYLALRAARAGARVLPATIAFFSQSKLSLSGRFRGSLIPGVIIGADGSHSSIARSIGSPSMEQGICMEYEIADVNIDPDATEMYFGARCAPGGYAWIIPIGSDIANVGVGVRSSYLGRTNLHKVLEMFVREHPVAGPKLKDGEVLAIMRGNVPAGGMPDSIHLGNVLLAGDAAGQVMATSGGGIPLAMVAGKIAGEVATGFMKGQTALGDYRQRVDGEFGRELERSVQMRRMLDVIMRSDKLMDTLFEALDSNQIKSIMRGQIPFGLNRITRSSSRNFASE
jgi:digeranylgeranylglycerophospholipid reductase